MPAYIKLTQTAIFLFSILLGAALIKEDVWETVCI